jgi:hypothetical protein
MKEAIERGLKEFRFRDNIQRPRSRTEQQPTVQEANVVGRDNNPPRARHILVTDYPDPVETAKEKSANVSPVRRTLRGRDSHSGWTGADHWLIPSVTSRSTSATT